MRLTLKSAYPVIFEKHPAPWHRFADVDYMLLLVDARNKRILSHNDNIMCNWLFELYLFVMPIPHSQRIRYGYNIPVPSVFARSPLPWTLSRGADGNSAIYCSGGDKVSQWKTGDKYEESRIALYQLARFAERRLRARIYGGQHAY